RASETVAGADGGAHIFGADFDGSQRRIAGVLIRDVLVDGLLRFDLSEYVASVFVAVRRRSKAVEERGTCTKMDRRSPGRFHLADRYELVAERLERLHHGLEREVAPLFLRMPGVGPYAAREVDSAEAERRGRGGGERRYHRVHKRQRNRGAHGASHEGT